MKLGYIDYLNCYPFYYSMMEKKPLDDVRLFPAYPSELNGMMIRGELDMSPVSAAAYTDMQEDALILPDFCLSSIGYVRSVVLISRMPIEDLDGRKLGLSSASQTSMVLLKILLEKFYDIRPVYLPSPPNPSLEGIDAALVIGNEAMLNATEPIPYTYDLGDLWLRKTGYPVVFAVFTVRTRAIAAHRELIGRIIESYRESLLCLQTERQTLIAGAARKYPDIVFDIDTYYTLLKFDFTPELKQALQFYFQQAAEMKLLKKAEQLNFYS